MDFVARYAAALGEGLTEGTAIDLGDGADAAVAELAALVSRRGEQEDAAAAAFLAGCYVALRVNEGADARKALDEAVRVARRLHPAGH